MESTKTEVWPGQAYPLGATYDGIGTNFTLFSEVAERVELCLFDDRGGNGQRLDFDTAIVPCRPGRSRREPRSWSPPAICRYTGAYSGHPAAGPWEPITS